MSSENLQEKISSFQERPNAVALLNLIEEVKEEVKPIRCINVGQNSLEQNSLEQNSHEQLISKLQFLSRALKGGNVDLTRYVEETKQLAEEIRLGKDEIRNTINSLITSNQPQGMEIATQYRRDGEYKKALNSLKSEFGIEKIEI
jgi:hypothetical protein